VTHPFVPDEAFLGICSWEASSGTIGISVNGLPFLTNANPAARCSDPSFGLGAFASGSGGAAKSTFADLLVFRSALHEKQNVDLLDLVKSYVRSSTSIFIS
jgi:hypothetical protein